MCEDSEIYTYIFQCHERRKFLDVTSGDVCRDMLSDLLDWARTEIKYNATDRPDSEILGIEKMRDKVFELLDDYGIILD